MDNTEFLEKWLQCMPTESITLTCEKDNTITLKKCGVVYNAASINEILLQVKDYHAKFYLKDCTANNKKYFQANPHDFKNDNWTKD
jgi:hypothetical protein